MEAQQQAEKIKREIISKFSVYAETCLMIKDKKGQIVPFRLNNAQKIIDEIIENDLAKGKPLRYIILKARQEGVSTYFEGRVYHRQANNINRKAIIVGHEAKAATNLFNIFKTYHEHIDEYFEPSILHSNEKKLSFGVLRSEIEIASAESRESLGRSSTNQDLHATEVGFWPGAEESMLALLQTIPDEPNTLVAIESTANGIGGWFYDTWQGAMNGENDFTPIFLAWFHLPEYEKVFDDEDEKERLKISLSEYEKDLINRFNLTLEQINWYRYTLRNKCGNDKDRMKQEYPSTPEEAFITSGRPVFDIKICYKNYLESHNPMWQGNLEYVLSDTGEPLDVKFIPNPKGYLKIYERFEISDNEEYRFAAGCDVAEGLAQGDYSVIKIYDRKTKTFPITWHGHIDPDLLAIEQHKLQLFLKDKWFINTERNNHGLTTIVGAYKLGVSQKYQQNFTKGYEIKGNQELGFKTNLATKPVLINNLSEAIRDHLFDDQEQEFWSETMTFVRNEKGHMQAQDKDKNPGIKCFDDRVIASALAIDCSIWMPNYYVEEVDNLPEWYKKEFEEDLDPRKSITVMGV